MIKKVSIEDLKTILYGICIFFYALLQSNLTKITSFNSFLFQTCMYLALVFMFLLSITKIKTINLKTIIKIILIILLFLWIFISIQQEKEILLILIGMILCYDIDYKKILKSYSISVGLTIVLVVLLSMIDVLPNYIDSIGRNSLGFKYTTFSANLFFSGIIAYATSKKEKLKIFEIIMIIIANIYLYFKTNTLAVFIEIFVFLLIYLFIDETKKSTKKKTKIKNFLITFSPYIIAIATIFFQIYYNNNSNVFLDKINELLSGRLSLGKKAFSMYKITLFGQKIIWNYNGGGKYFYIDSSYINILFSYGIVTLVTICHILKKILNYSLNHNYLILTLSIIIFLIHSITDPQMLTFRYNPFIILYLGFLIKENKQKERSDFNEKI